MNHSNETLQHGRPKGKLVIARSTFGVDVGFEVLLPNVSIGLVLMAYVGEATDMVPSCDGADIVVTYGFPTDANVGFREPLGEVNQPQTRTRDKRQSRTCWRVP